MTVQQRGEETRERILQAAMASFAERGYDGTPVNTICAEAGVSKGAFYHHFSSKQGVFLELLHGWLSGMDEGLADLQTDRLEIPEQLMAMTNMICDVFDAAGDQLPMFLEFWSQAAHDPEVWEATRAPYRRYRAFFAAMIEAGIAEGSIRPVDPDTTARVIVSLAVGLVLQGLLDTEGADWGRVTTGGVRMLLEGISTEERP